MVEIFTQGACFDLYKILKSIYPDAESWYDPIVGHIYTRIGKYWYDIRGIHYKLPEHSEILGRDHGKKIHRWNPFIKILRKSWKYNSSNIRN
ncbi:hypothetical protein YerA41_057 [Yersinia phage YerA41]|nr:hypothetical protein YerA41_057 [Yersinia phage YerA41]